MARRSTSYSAILLACALSVLVGCPAHGPTEAQPDGSSDGDRGDDTGGARDAETPADDTQSSSDARDGAGGDSVDDADGRADGGTEDGGDAVSDAGGDASDTQTMDAGDAEDDTATDSTVPPPDTAETGTETGVDAADGGGPAVQPAQGDVIVTEIMASPEAIGDDKGEYFEIYNTSSSEAFDLEDCIILDTGQDSHKLSSSELTAGSSLVLQPGSRFTLAKSTMAGFSPDYTFPSHWYLSGSDEIILECNSTTVDEVDYTGWSVGPNDGAALGFDPAASKTATANDQPTNWCDQSTSLPNSSDKGTPGQPNDSCS